MNTFSRACQTVKKNNVHLCHWSSKRREKNDIQRNNNRKHQIWENLITKEDEQILERIKTKKFTSKHNSQISLLFQGKENLEIIAYLQKKHTLNDRRILIKKTRETRKR